MSKQTDQIRKLLSRVHEIKNAPLMYAANDLQRWFEIDLEQINDLLDEIDAQEQHLEQQAYVIELNRAIEKEIA